MTAGPGDGIPAGPVGRGRLRVSHLDREHVVEVLKAAFVQGRLTKEEFDLRVGQALASRTFADLAALTTDLPAGLIRTRQRRMPARARPPVSKVVRSGAGVMVAAAALGLLAGIVFAMLSPPLFTSRTLVVLPASAARHNGTQVAIAGSPPVLEGALPNVKPATSLPALRSEIQVKSLTSSIISISAQGETAAQAARTANAVAGSYIAYLDAATPGGQAQARVLDPALWATGTPLPARLLVPGGLGALLGALIGAIAALAFGRRDRRLSNPS
jgi:capsular polysaccharide biosynthesis protein